VGSHAAQQTNVVAQLHNVSAQWGGGSRWANPSPLTFAGANDLLLVAQVTDDETSTLVSAAAHVKHGHAPLAAVQQLPHQVLT